MYLGKPIRSYDVSSGGKRFLMIKSASADPATVPPNIVAVLHFDEELKRQAVVKSRAGHAHRTLSSRVCQSFHSCERHRANGKFIQSLPEEGTTLAHGMPVASYRASV